MSLTTETDEVSYAGNNSTTTGYPIPFTFLANTDIKVYVDQVETTDFAVHQASSGADPTYEVKTTAAIAITKTVTITRTVPLTQTLDLVPSGDLPSSLLERTLDKIVMGLQQLWRHIQNAHRVPEGETVNELPAAADRKGHWWQWDPTTGAYAGQTNAQLATAISTELGGVLTVDVKATQTFANDSNRNATAPAFTGQLGVQLDTGCLWRGTGTSAGNWAKCVDDIQTGSTDSAKNSATPEWIGQLYFKTDDKTWWVGYATSSGAWGQTSQAPYAAFAAPSSSAWSHGGSATAGNYYSLTDPRTGLSQVWKCRLAHTMNDGNSGSGGAAWNGSSDNRPGVYDTASGTNSDQPYLRGNEVWRNLPGSDLDPSGSVYHGALWEPWIQEGYHYHRILDDPGMNKGSEFNDRYVMGEPGNHTDWHLVHDWLIRNAKSNRDTTTINQVVANDAARASASPSAVGDIALQTDTNQLYYATGTSAGNWAVNDEGHVDEFRRVQTGFQLIYQGGTYRTSREIKMLRNTSVLGASSVLDGESATIFRWVQNMTTAKVIDKNLFRVGADDYKTGGVGSADKGATTAYTEFGNFVLNLNDHDPRNAISNGAKVYLGPGSKIRPLRFENVGWSFADGEIYALQIGQGSEGWTAESIVINSTPLVCKSVPSGDFNELIHGGSSADGNNSTSTPYVTPSYSSTSHIDVYYDGVKKDLTTHYTFDGSSKVITSGGAVAPSVKVEIVNNTRCHDRCKTIGVDFQATNQNCHIESITASLCNFVIRTDQEANGIRIAQVASNNSNHLFQANGGGAGVEILGIVSRRDDGQGYGATPILTAATPLAHLNDVDVVDLGLRLQGVCSTHTGVASNVAMNSVLVSSDATSPIDSIELPDGTFYLQGRNYDQTRLAFDWNLKDHAYPGYFLDIIGRDGSSKVTLNGSTIAGPVSISSAEADANAAGIRKYAPFIYDDGTSQFLMVKKA